MIRKSFRFGLWVGLLCGIAVAVVKVVQARRTTPVTSAEPWVPLDREPPVAPTATATAPAARPAPTAPAAEPEPHPELALAAAPDDVATDDPPPPPAPEETPPAVYAAKRVAKKAAKATEAAAKAAKVTEALDNVAAAPAKKAAKKAKAPARVWVEPVGDVCPDSHPVKAKLASKILHPPGSPSYDRTVPDRCYKSAEAAESDGFRSAKR